MDIETRIFKGELRSIGKKRIEGFIPYNERSVDMGFIETLLPGCFSESLRDKGRGKILAFWNHDTAKPLGSTEAGTLKIEDRADGLSFTIYPPQNSWGQDALESVDRGDTTDVSFGFNVQKEQWNDDVREIVKAELFEISPVSFGAYPQTKIQARSRGKIMDIRELYNERNKLHERQKAILDKANSEGRNVSAEEKQEYEKIDVDFLKLTDQINAKNKVTSDSEDLARRFDERQQYMKSNATNALKPELDSNDNIYQRDRNDASQEMRDFTKYLRVGKKGLNRDEERRFEARALQMDIDPSGGYLVAPEQFVKSILTKLDDSVFIRQYATVIPCRNAHSLGQPMLANDPDDGDWTAEILTGSEDDTMDFEKRELYPHPIAKRIKVSSKLIRASGVDVAGFVRDRLAYKFAIPEEKCFIGSDVNHGTGVNQPLGVMTVSNAGISAARDVSDGNLAGAIKPDGLINAFFSLKAQYRKKARWIFHRDAIKQIRKLKTGEGDYIWRSGLADGRPDTILGKPYDESEYQRNTFEASQYVGIIGDFSFYHIADALDMQIQVLTELYAETNRTGFIGRKETDAMPVIEEAFARVKLGA